MLNRIANRSAGGRVIVYTPEPKHGLALYVSEVVVALATCGVPIVLFCPANFEYEAKVREAGADVVHAGGRDVSMAGLSERLLRNLKFVALSALVQFRLVRRGDVVHFQSMLHLPLGFVFVLLAIARGGSIVLTAHDPLPHRWRFPRRLRWIERKMLELCYRLSDRIIVHNTQGKEVLLREFHQQERRIAVIPHGPYSEPADEDSGYPRFDCLRLLAFGSIRENKGLHLTIEAIQKAGFASRIPVRLTIAGQVQNAAEEQYWRTCKQLIAAQPDGIEVIESHIADDAVGPLLARHHAVVLPYTEFFSESGVAALALSHRRPILATAAGGLSELIERGACGIAIESASAEAVAQAVLKAIQFGPERLRQMGVTGSEFIRRERSWDFIALQTAGVYSELVKRNPEASLQPDAADSEKDEVRAERISCP